MKSYHCRPADRPLDATVTLPGSKSITNRALLIAALADGQSILKGVLLAEDTLLMIDALRTLGIRISVDEAAGVAEVTGCGGHVPSSGAELFCGNSGTTIRFCSALASLARGRFTLDGIARMRERPIAALGDVLNALGAGIEYADRPGYPPLTIHASGLSGGKVGIHDVPSSQMISALLMVAPYAAQDIMVEATGNLPSLPYVRMTTAVMERFNVVVLENYLGEPCEEARFVVEAPQRYQGTTYAVEPDASNATYFLASAAIAGGSVTVRGLGTASIQGDARFVDVLEKMGCKIKRASDSLTVSSPSDGRRLCGVDVDLNAMPDAVQTLSVVALFAEGPTTIRNIANLRLKETDRIRALCNELSKLGAKVEEEADSLIIHPPDVIQPALIETYEDHRMAMSFALVGLRVDGIVIQNPDCCRKTFPDFFQRFEELTSSRV